MNRISNTALIVILAALVNAQPAQAKLRGISHTMILVADYDAAISWYTGVLKMELRADTEIAPGIRFIAVGSKKNQGASLILFKPTPQTGNKLYQFLATDDFDADYLDLKSKGVRFTSEPMDLPWGKEAMFEDPQGNGFVLVEPTE